MRHTLSILVENRFGELSRVVGLFSARGYNIESLTVAETLDPKLSRLTLVTIGDDAAIERITRQLDKQVRVMKVEDVTATPHIEREMALINVKAAAGPARQEVLSLLVVYQCFVVIGLVALADTPRELEFVRVVFALIADRERGHRALQRRRTAQRQHVPDLDRRHGR